MANDLSDQYNLRGMGDEELALWKAGWKESSAQYVLADLELQRRREQRNTRRFWIAIVIAVFSLIVAVFSLIVAVLR